MKLILLWIGLSKGCSEGDEGVSDRCDHPA